MMPPVASGLLLGRRPLLGWAAALLLWSLSLGQDALAAGPFAGFSGSWSGTGTIQLANGNKERIRCRATYRVKGSSDSDLDLQLRCDSDTYKFDLTGNFSAGSEQISGQWTERTRNVGGSVIGRARGERIQVHAETGGFAADITMVTQKGRQSVTIDSRGGGERVQTSITLRQN